MKWLFLNSSSQQETYELSNSSEKLLTLTHHPASGGLRIAADDEKRVFLVGSEGFLRTRTVLRNEYGLRIGQIVYENNGENSGTIEIYNEQFTCLVQTNSKVGIYKNAELLTVCDLPSTKNGRSRDLLVLTLCWYLSISVKRPVAEFA